MKKRYNKTLKENIRKITENNTVATNIINKILLLERYLIN